MEDIIVVAILAAIAVGIILYLVRSKKKGKGCVGCPYAGQCKSSCFCKNEKNNTD